MDTGTLTPRTNNTVEAMRFTGSFGQPNGFGSVLLAEVKQDGRLVLTLTYNRHGETNASVWSVELDSSQRNALAALASRYQPRLYERIDNLIPGDRP
jgi:hypothetical protein